MHCHNSARSPSFLLSFAEVHSVFSSLKKMSGERKSFHVCTSRTQIANWRKRKTELLSSLPSLSLSLPALSLSPQSAFKLSAFGGTSTELSLPSMGCSSEGGWVLEVLSLFSGFFLPWVPGSLSSSVRFCGWAVERTKEQHGNVRRRSDRSIGLRPSRLSSPSSVPLIGCLRTDGRTTTSEKVSDKRNQRQANRTRNLLGSSKWNQVYQCLDDIRWAFTDFQV